MLRVNSWPMCQSLSPNEVKMIYNAESKTTSTCLAYIWSCFCRGFADITVIGDESLASIYPIYQTYPWICRLLSHPCNDWISNQDYLLSCYKSNGFASIANSPQTHNYVVVIIFNFVPFYTRALIIVDKSSTK